MASAPLPGTSVPNSFTIASYNMYGFSQGAVMLDTLCNINKFEIINLQEHWLSTDLLHNFDVYKTSYYIFGISAMDSSITSGILRGRPYGGVMSLISKSFCDLFETVTCIACAERYVIVALDKLLLVNVYLPYCRNDHDIVNLCEVLNCILAIIASLNYDYIIFGGFY